MTLVLGLRCRDGVVLAADSQRTEGNLRQMVPKLFTSPARIIWGTAGSIAIQQELHAILEQADVPPQPGRTQVRDLVVAATREAVHRATSAMDDPSPVATEVRGIFAWYSAAENRTYVLRANGKGYAEFADTYAAVGAPADFARFALGQSEHLEYASLPLEATKMVAYKVADDVIRASARTVGHPIQMAVVTPTQAAVAPTVEVRGLSDTVAAFREHQRNFLVREEPREERADTGIRPD
jgi:proteasome beta subunit